jgi:hypothetical protein
LADCVFTNNNIAIDKDWDSAISVDRCTFSGNKTSVHCYTASGVHISESTFLANASPIYLGGGGPATIRGCVFKKHRYGAVRTSSGWIELANCLFAGNSRSTIGSALNMGPATANLRNCTFVNNRSLDGGATIETSLLSSDLTVTNCIIDGPNPINTSSAFGAKVNVDHSNLAGDWMGSGNSDMDPCFVDPGYWDPNGTPEDPNDDFWVDGDYHLKSQAGRWDPTSGSWLQDDVTSPCIDAGNPMTPIGPEPFPSGGIINMGAYGGTAEASKSYFNAPTCQTITAGDINGDCTVDFKDFTILALHWLEQH